MRRRRVSFIQHGSTFVLTGQVAGVIEFAPDGDADKSCITTGASRFTGMGTVVMS